MHESSGSAKLQQICTQTALFPGVMEELCTLIHVHGMDMCSKDLSQEMSDPLPIKKMLSSLVDMHGMLFNSPMETVQL